MKRKSLAFAILDSPFLIPLQRRAEAGYSMVVLIVAITVLNILVAAMLPLWSTQIRREKEEELIFRGFQYAEAIRVFQKNNNGQYPTQLEQLIKVKPRCIRQLWKDPMTEDGKWGLILAGQPDPNQGQQGQQGQQGGLQGQKGGQSTEEDENGRPPQSGPKEGDTVQAGPIIGVYSKSKEKSMIVLFGRERYDEWKFRADLLIGGDGGQMGGAIKRGEGGAILGVGPSGVGPSGGTLQYSVRWLGRPMHYLNRPTGPQDGTMPDGRPPGGTRNRPQRSPQR